MKSLRKVSILSAGASARRLPRACMCKKPPGRDSIYSRCSQKGKKSRRDALVFIHVIRTKAKRAAGTRWYLFTLFAKRQNTQKELPGRDSIYLRCSQKGRRDAKRAAGTRWYLFTLFAKKQKFQLFDKTKKLHRHRKRQQQQSRQGGVAPKPQRE